MKESDGLSVPLLHDSTMNRGVFFLLKESRHGKKDYRQTGSRGRAHHRGRRAEEQRAERDGQQVDQVILMHHGQTD